MQGVTTRFVLHTAATALALVIGVLPGAAGANDGWDPDAEDPTAVQIDDHEAPSRDSDDMRGRSHEPDAATPESADPDDRIAETEDPDHMTAGSGTLPAPRPGAEGAVEPGRAAEAPARSGWGRTAAPDVSAARAALAQAKERADAAEAAYGEMMKRNYPRGDARLRIVNERDDALKAYDDAHRAMLAAEAGS